MLHRLLSPPVCLCDEEEARGNAFPPLPPPPGCPHYMTREGRDPMDGQKFSLLLFLEIRKMSPDSTALAVVQIPGH